MAVFISGVSLLYKTLIPLRGVFFKKFRFFCFFKVTFRQATFHIENPLMTNLTYSQMMPNEQKKSVF